MARPKSEEKRTAILQAALRVFAVQGLAAPTALIAQEAGVSNGSLFLYFETKAELLNQLYLTLKTEMAQSISGAFRIDADLRHRMHEVWKRWLQWSIEGAEKRRVLAVLAVSEELTPETRARGQALMADFEAFVMECCAGGTLRDAPVRFAAALINAVVETAVEFISRDPARAEEHSERAFEVVWHLVN